MSKRATDETKFHDIDGAEEPGTDAAASSPPW